jgi:hypothetical protein
MNRPRLIHGLRIAWSVWWGILCVLLIALWVSSYLAEVRLSGRYTASRGFRVYSSRGCIVCYAPNMPFQPSSYPWHLALDSQHWLRESDARIASVPKLHYHSQEMWATFPHWFLLGLCGALAITPWVIQRFSLRTLLIATTLITVVLGLVVIMRR